MAQDARSQQSEQQYQLDVRAVLEARAFEARAEEALLRRSAAIEVDAAIGERARTRGPQQEAMRNAAKVHKWKDVQGLFAQADQIYWRVILAHEAEVRKQSWVEQRRHARSLDIETVVQLARVAWWKALLRWDPDQDVTVATYAQSYVMAELQRSNERQGDVDAGRHARGGWATLRTTALDAPLLTRGGEGDVTLLDLLITDDDPAETASHRIDNARNKARVVAAIARLPATQHAALSQHLQGASDGEIARARGRTRQAIQVARHKGMEMIRQHLGLIPNPAAAVPTAAVEREDMRATRAIPQTASPVTLAKTAPDAGPANVKPDAGHGDKRAVVEPGGGAVQLAQTAAETPTFAEVTSTLPPDLAALLAWIPVGVEKTIDELQVECAGDPVLKRGRLSGHIGRLAQRGLLERTARRTYRRVAAAPAEPAALPELLEPPPAIELVVEPKPAKLPAATPTIALSTAPTIEEYAAALAVDQYVPQQKFLRVVLAAILKARSLSLTKIGQALEDPGEYKTVETYLSRSLIRTRLDMNAVLRRYHELVQPVLNRDDGEGVIVRVSTRACRKPWAQPERARGMQGAAKEDEITEFPVVAIEALAPARAQIPLAHWLFSRTLPDPLTRKPYVSDERASAEVVKRVAPYVGRRAWWILDHEEHRRIVAAHGARWLLWISPDSTLHCRANGGVTSIADLAAKTPLFAISHDPVIARMSAQVVRAVHMKACTLLVVECWDGTRFALLASEPVGTTPEEIADFARRARCSMYYSIDFEDFGVLKLVSIQRLMLLATIAAGFAAINVASSGVPTPDLPEVLMPSPPPPERSIKEAVDEVEVALAQLDALAAECPDFTPGWFRSLRESLSLPPQATAPAVLAAVQQLVEVAATPVYLDEADLRHRVDLLNEAAALRQRALAPCPCSPRVAAIPDHSPTR